MYQNTMLNKDLRPLNIAQTMPEETRVSPVATSGRNIEGFYVNPPHDAGSPGAIPVYYPAAVPDAGFVGLAYSNAVPGVTGWCPRMPTAMVASPGANLTPGYSQNPNFGTMVGSNVSDQASDEGGDDSVSGKKVKFLCSFGGKILPRPSDGMLRYVGGQTRIISVRRDVNFNELVQKMVDACGQNVVIKYQLPEEDLDALVSVSCPDDLENMMDEYEKLVERSSDGLAKLRVFLFSASELDCSGMVQFGEQDSGQRYVEAVNGITEGVDDGIMRKESIASAASTQNSDLSGTEAIDNSSHGKGDVIGPPSTGIISPKSNSTTSQEPAPRFVCMDPSPSIYAEASSTPLGIVMSGPPQSLSSQPEYELERSVPATIPQQQIGVELQQPGVNFHPPIAYMHPQQETWNRADYVQVPSQMGFPTHLMGTIGPVFTRPQFHDNAAGVSPHQFVPAVHMTMTSSHANMKPNMVLPMVQHQPIRLEHHPDESTYGGRVVQLPGDQILNAYQAQAPPAMVGGVYGWNQVPQPEQVVFSEGWVPQQQVMVPEKIPRFKDCYMCEKELPHAHSDTIVQDQRESPVSPASDLNPVFHSLQLEDKMGAPPMNRAVVTGALGEVEQGGIGARQNFLSPIDHEARKPPFEVAGLSQNVVRQYESDRIILQKTENPDLPKVSFPQGVGGPAGIQSPYGAAMSTPPQPCHESAAQQFAVPPQYHVQPEVSMNKPVDYSSKLSVVAPKEDTVESYDHVKQIDGMMESLWISPTEAFANNEQSKLTSDNLWKEDILDARPQQIAGREPCLVNTSSKPRMVVDKNQNFRPLESYEVAQPPLLGKPTYQQSKLGINFLAPDEGSYGTPAFSGVDSAHTTERIPPVGEWKDNPSRFQPKVPPGDVDTVAFNGNTPSSISPSNWVGDTQNISNSLFSNQDPWNLQHDHFPPPIPNKIAIRKAGFGATDFFGENHLGNVGELPMGNRGDSTEEVPLEDGVYQPAVSTNMDFGSEQIRTTQGSAEELIKQELQAVAEGVAASVLQSSMPSNPDIAMHETNETFPESNQDSEVQDTDVELHKDDFEDIKPKLPEKTNLVFPISDGIGRLQIIKNSDLEELRELGSGTFGTVYHGKWRGTDVAIKRINDRCFAGKPSEQERMRDDFWNEAINLADLHHPNVVAFYGVVLDGPGGSVATVTEYMVNGSLRNALQKNERNLDKRKRLLIAMDVAFGMEYLHGKNIVHFDLKSDNLLVNLRDPHRPICKVGDLGLSKVKCQTLISGGVRGTLPWMAPELLNGSSSLVSEKVDVFSFGIVLWELLTGEEPYADLHYGAIIGGIVSNTLRPPVPESCDSEWRALMERCWSSEPQERPSFTEIANGLRAMASKIPPKAQAQQQVPSTLPQVKS